MPKGGVSTMSVVVKRKANDTDDRMIAEFRKMVLENDLIELYKSKMFHLKPSALKNKLRGEKRRSKVRRPRSR